MKKTYKQPKFINHGNVRSLTQVLGNNSTGDALSIGGEIFGEGETFGSRNLEAPSDS